MLTLQRGIYYGSRVSSLRTSADQPRANEMMHTETELQCPDRYRLRISGAVTIERIVIGDMKYERRGDGAWSSIKIVPPIPELRVCDWANNNRNARPPDEADVAAMNGVAGNYSVMKGPIREIHGVKCQPYTISAYNRQPFTACYAVEGTPYQVYTERGKTTRTNYDFNKPIKIEAPLTEAASSRAH